MNQCKECGRGFESISQPNKRFCCGACQKVYNNRLYRQRRSGGKKPERCKTCGKFFKPTDDRHVFCSKQCKNTYHNAMNLKPDPVCPTCGKVFKREAKGQVYCSLSCKKAPKAKPVEKKPSRRHEFKDPFTTGLRVPGLDVVTACPQVCPLEPYADSWVDWVEARA